MENTQKQLVTLSEAAGMLRMSPLTIRRAIKSGRIKAMQLNPKGRYRIFLADLNEFMMESAKAIH